MKKVLFALMAVFTLATTANAQEVNTDNGAKIKFEKTTHDYGDVEFEGNGVCTFDFTNTGNAPLIISNAKGSCGCTVPDWPKEPIAPGKTATITVKYRTNRAGLINKSVTITSNAVNEPTSKLYIKGKVLPKPEGGAPVNNSGAPTNQ